jgi:hypothetical protein
MRSIQEIKKAMSSKNQDEWITFNEIDWVINQAEKVERYEKALEEISRVGYSKTDRQMWFSPDSHLKCVKIALEGLED